MPARVGDRFGPYLLLHKIAQGGMGEVFLARKEGAEGFSRHVVVKRMLSHLADRGDFLEMFFAEARLSSRLHHERIVQVHDAGRIGDEFFLEMEFVAGVDLKVLLERADHVGRILPIASMCELIAQAAEGLSYAHGATDHDGKPLNLVHRDINPANLLVSWEGEVKIIDLGIAKSELHHGKTETGMLKGKFLYMSPEQSEGNPVGSTTDLFSLGIVLYESVVGRHPFDRGTLARTLAAIQSDPLPTMVDPQLFALEPIFERVLAKAVADRYPDGDAFAAALRKVITQLEPPPLFALLLADLFAEEQSYLTQILAQDDAEELKRLDRLTYPPVEAMPALPEGMEKPEGWTDFWHSGGPGSVRSDAPTAHALPHPEVALPVEVSLSTTGLFLQSALSTSRRMWMAVGLFAVLVMYWGLADTGAEPVTSSRPVPQPPAKVQPDAAVSVLSVDAGPARRTDATAPKSRPVTAPVVVLPQLTASSSRLRIAGLSKAALAAKNGRFSAKGGGLSVEVSWRRSEGGMAISIGATPWAIVYRNQGPALGRTPPVRQLRIRLGGDETLRFKHPKLGEFKLDLRLKQP
jgi:serine/threonine protein kinase